MILEPSPSYVTQVGPSPQAALIPIGKEGTGTAGPLDPRRFTYYRLGELAKPAGIEAPI